MIFCTLALRFTLLSLSLSLSFLDPGFPLSLPSFLYSLFLRNADPSTITRYDTDPDSKRYGLDVKEAGKRFYICDADGLITKVTFSTQLLLIQPPWQVTYMMHTEIVTPVQAWNRDVRFSG